LRPPALWICFPARKPVPRCATGADADENSRLDESRKVVRRLRSADTGDLLVMLTGELGRITAIQYGDCFSLRGLEMRLAPTDFLRQKAIAPRSNDRTSAAADDS
jgi:inorganic triphosphatase YgiF